MSWGTCYSGTNNIHHDKPPLMSDRRLFTLTNPACDINKKLSQAAGVKSNYEYRQYLMSNGKTLIENNTIKACDECSECVKYTKETEKTNKYLYKSLHDNHVPYGYQASDLKNLYLTRQQQNGKYVSPIVTQDELLKYSSR